MAKKVKVKKNLSPEFVKLLRQVQKFLIDEPARFNMKEGIKPSANVPGQLAEPPCGTACCYAGAAYVIDKKIKLKLTDIYFSNIEHHLAKKFNFFGEIACRLYYVGGLHSSYQSPGVNSWPAFYATLYDLAKTPLERACVGVARIEHFIATDGAE